MQSTELMKEERVQGMATLKASSTILSFLMVIGAVSAIGEPAQASCDDQIRGLITQCSEYVLLLGPQIAPSEDCCAVVHQADQDCVCSHVTGAVESLISMKKAVYVAFYCHRPLAPGTQCGSYTVPING